MAASCVGFDSHTNTGSFCISKESEIIKLPTTVRSGTDELRNVSPVSAGSDCVVIESSEVLLLDGNDNIWKKI